MYLYIFKTTGPCLAITVSKWLARLYFIFAFGWDSSNFYVSFLQRRVQNYASKFRIDIMNYRLDWPKIGIMMSCIEFCLILRRLKDMPRNGIIDKPGCLILSTVFRNKSVCLRVTSHLNPIAAHNF